MNAKQALKPDPVRRQAVRVLAALGGATMTAGARLGGMAVGSLGASRVLAADPPRFPSRSVRIIVPYSVGVGPDVVARSLAESLERRWQQSVIVENKPGGSGIIAFGDVRRTAPDGHTLLVADTATLAVNPLLHSSLPYDVQRDLVPLTELFRATFVLWTGGKGRFATLEDMLAAARVASGAVSYASLGNGHASQVAIESFAREAGIRLLHVPFRDAGSLTSTLAAGDVDFTAFGINTVAGLAATGKLRALAVAARRRLASHPEIPTVAEAGGPATEMHPWAALVTIAGTPQPLVERLHRDLVDAMRSDEVLARAASAGFEITPSSPQALRARIAEDSARYAPLVDEGRIAKF